MANRRKPADDNPTPLPRPATTLEGREDQLIAAAMDLVERRIHNDTASAQETVHFLKLGSVRNQLEQDKLRQENELLQTRVKEMENRKDSGEMFEKALRAFQGYAGMDEEVDDASDIHGFG